MDIENKTAEFLNDISVRPPKSINDIVNEITRKNRAICKSRELNLSIGRRGVVRVDRIIHRFAKDTNKKHPTHNGFKNINVCSTTDLQEFKGLSPFLLGPVNHGDPFFPPSKTVENFWQWIKVYKQDINEFGNPSPKYFEKRRMGFASSKAKKRSNRLRKDFLYIYHGGKRYSYLEGRGKYYCKVYADLVIHSNSYMELTKLLDRGTNIQILGYDGVDYHSEEDPDGSILYQHFSNANQSFGHEMVLVGLLSNRRVWEW